MKNLISVVIVVAVLAYKFTVQADRDENGVIVGEGDVGAFAIQLGDCFNDTSSLLDADGGEVSSLPAVPCSEPHDNEVYAVFNVTEDEFPGEEAMSELAMDGCLARFEGFVGRDYASSSLDVTTLYPSPSSWTAQNDREVVCAVYDVNFEKLTASVKGSAI